MTQHRFFRHGSSVKQKSGQDSDELRPTGEPARHFEPPVSCLHNPRLWNRIETRKSVVDLCGESKIHHTSKQLLVFAAGRNVVAAAQPKCARPPLLSRHGAPSV